jgi:hypothetical protein
LIFFLVVVVGRENDHDHDDNDNVIAAAAKPPPPSKVPAPFGRDQVDRAYAVKKVFLLTRPRPKNVSKSLEKKKSHW